MDEDDRQNRKGGPTFEPPVYKQRYDFVEKIVREFGAKKVDSIPLSVCVKTALDLCCLVWICDTQILD